MLIKRKAGWKQQIKIVKDAMQATYMGQLFRPLYCYPVGYVNWKAGLRSSNKAYQKLIDIKWNEVVPEME